jgi:hypothetical protein
MHTHAFAKLAAKSQPPVNYGVTKGKTCWVLVAHACNPSYSEGSEGSRFEANPRHTVHEALS